MILAIRVVGTQTAMSPAVTTSPVARSTTIAAMITLVTNTTGKDRDQHKARYQLLQ